jgi:hypothetical protein
MKVGRNAPCPCGSGKKYKKCCGGVFDKRSFEMSSDELKFERIGQGAPCPCQNGRSFGMCHGRINAPPPETPPPLEFVPDISIRQGATPDWLKHLIEAAIRHLFNPAASGSGLLQPRGESCATVAMHTQRLLRLYGVTSRFVVGAARWRDHPAFYRWSGQDEYHAWVETEFGEIVDLACDDLNSRTDLSYASTTVPSPRNCWDLPTALSDRGYVEIEGGYSRINVDIPGEAGFDVLARLASKFCEEHEVISRERYP